MTGTVCVCGSVRLVQIIYVHRLSGVVYEEVKIIEMFFVDVE